MSEDIMQKSMVIYKITNTIPDENGHCKAYIGQTIRALGERIREHKIAKTAIGTAIQEFGWQNFTVNILDECKTLEELNDRETFWIATLGTRAPNGYNMTDGGETQPHDNLKAVICLDNGMIFESIADAARRAGVAYPSISNVCNGKRLRAGGHRWAFVENPVEPKTTDNRGKHSCLAVRCVETGEEFESLSAASRHYNVSYRRIAAACGNIEYTAAGLHWQWATATPIVLSEVKLSQPRGRREVRCIETGVVYESISAAAKDIGVSPSSVHSACNGKVQTIKGRHFEFVDPVGKINKESRRNTATVNSIPVLCIETGIVYTSMREAAESVGIKQSGISAALRGEYNKAGGFHWRRLDSNEEIDFTDHRFRAVRCIETGIVYESAATAAASLELNLSSLYSVCNGKSQTIKGLHFEYVDPTEKRVMSDEERRNRLEATAVPVLCIETGIEYESLASAERATGIKAGTIGGVCLGKRKTAGGFHWRRLDRPVIETSEPELRSNCRSVRCLTNGIVYQSVSMAAEALELNSSSISKVCRGKQRAVKGYVFEYVD